MRPILYYVHDPMCSWCWGFTQSFAELVKQLSNNIKIKRLLGGLAKDTDATMPVGMQNQIKSNWSRIEDTIPGVKFNFDFWTNNIPRRSTYPACRAVIAARVQGDENDMAMTKAIQSAYYQEARNPSDNEVLIELASALHLNVELFKVDLISDSTQEILMNEIDFARELFAESYPNLVLKIQDEIYSIPVDYVDSNAMLENINSIVDKNTAN